MTKELLLKLFNYDRDAGTLIWKSHWRTNVVARLRGKRAGTLYNGYLRVEILSKPYQIHRLIWFLEHETEPVIVDHINGDTKNNRITNLRASDARYNCHNRKTHRAGKLVGTSWDKQRLQWKAQISFGHRTKFLGRFDTEQQAHQRYLEALREHQL